MNPLYQQNNPQPTIMDFKTKLSQMSPSFLTRMQEEARRRGISEKDIRAGMDMIRQLQR